MARRGAARGGSRAKAAAGRTTKSKKSAPVAQVEVVEEEGGSGIDAGIAVITTILLLVAILFVDAHLARYDAGMFF